MLNSSFERSYLTILCHCGKLMTVQRKTAAAVNTCGRQVTTTVRKYQWAQRGGPDQVRDSLRHSRPRPGLVLPCLGLLCPTDLCQMFAELLAWMHNALLEGLFYYFLFFRIFWHVLMPLLKFTKNSQIFVIFLSSEYRAEPPGFR